MRALYVIGVFLLFAASASANDDKTRIEAKKHFDEGAKQYKLGDFTGAVKEFRTSYELSAEPALLYNLGQTYRKLDQIEMALHSYRQYLADAPQGRHRAEVEAQIAALSSLLDEQRRVRQSPPAGTAPPESEAPKAAPIAPAVVAPPPAPPEHPADDSLRRRRNLGIAFCVAGAVAAVAGVILVAHAASEYSGATGAANEGELRDRLDAATNERIGGAVVIGVGAAVLVTGLVVLAFPSRDNSHSYWLRPSTSGLAFGGTF